MPLVSNSAKKQEILNEILFFVKTQAGKLIAQKRSCLFHFSSYHIVCTFSEAI